MKPITKILISAGLGLPLAAVAFFAWAAFGDHREIGLHYARVDWLPKTASDISYYRNDNIANVRVYEFRISRTDFEALAHERGWHVAAPPHRVSVVRYTELLPEGDPHRVEPFAAGTADGLFFENRYPNGGGTSVLFDNASSMAYVSSSNR